MRRSVYLCGIVVFFITSCSSTYYSRVSFPAPEDIFITTGDGDIQKPYTPIGQIIYSKSGYRIPLPLLGLIPIADVDPDTELKEGIFTRIKGMGGDALINMSIHFEPPRNGLLGLGATGGTITIYGTVIKR